MKKGFCHDCHATSAPQFRAGPNGPGTLCNACGLKHRRGTPVSPKVVKTGTKIHIKKPKRSGLDALASYALAMSPSVPSTRRYNPESRHIPSAISSAVTSAIPSAIPSAVPLAIRIPARQPIQQVREQVREEVDSPARPSMSPITADSEDELSSPFLHKTVNLSVPNPLAQPELLESMESAEIEPSLKEMVKKTTDYIASLGTPPNEPVTTINVGIVHLPKPRVPWAPENIPGVVKIGDICIGAPVGRTIEVGETLERAESPEL